MTEFNVAFRMHRDLFVVVDNVQRSKLLSHPKNRKAPEHCLRRGRGALFAFGKISPVIKRNRVVSTSCNRSRRRERRNLERAASPPGRQRQGNHD